MVKKKKEELKKESKEEGEQPEEEQKDIEEKLENIEEPDFEDFVKTPVSTSADTTPTLTSAKTGEALEETISETPATDSATEEESEEIKYTPVNYERKEEKREESGMRVEREALDFTSFIREQEEMPRERTAAMPRIDTAQERTIKYEPAKGDEGLPFMKHEKKEKTEYKKERAE